MLVDMFVVLLPENELRSVALPALLDLGLVAEGNVSKSTPAPMLVPLAVMTFALAKLLCDSAAWGVIADGTKVPTSTSSSLPRKESSARSMWAVSPLVFLSISASCRGQLFSSLSYSTTRHSPFSFGTGLGSTAELMDASQAVADGIKRIVRDPGARFQANAGASFLPDQTHALLTIKCTFPLTGSLLEVDKATTNQLQTTTLKTNLGTHNENAEPSAQSAALPQPAARLEPKATWPPRTADAISATCTCVQLNDDSGTIGCHETLVTRAALKQASTANVSLAVEAQSVTPSLVTSAFDAPSAHPPEQPNAYASPVAGEVGCASLIGAALLRSPRVTRESSERLATPELCPLCAVPLLATRKLCLDKIYQLEIRRESERLLRIGHKRVDSGGILRSQHAFTMHCFKHAMTVTVSESTLGPDELESIAQPGQATRTSMTMSAICLCPHAKLMRFHVLIVREPSMNDRLSCPEKLLVTCKRLKLPMFTEQPCVLENVAEKREGQPKQQAKRANSKNDGKAIEVAVTAAIIAVSGDVNSAVAVVSSTVATVGAVVMPAPAVSSDPPEGSGNAAGKARPLRTDSHRYLIVSILAAWLLNVVAAWFIAERRGSGCKRAPRLDRRDAGTTKQNFRRTDALSPTLVLPTYIKAFREFWALVLLSSLPMAVAQRTAYSFDTGCVTSTSVCPGWTTGPTSPTCGPSGSSPCGMNLQSGSTGSGSTGPNAGYGGSGYYYYAQTSSPRTSGDVYRLSYNGCDGGGLVTQIIFQYSMNGATVGTLRLVAESGAVLWARTGHQGSSWQLANVSVGASTFYFEVVRGTSYTGDVAVDEVVVDCALMPPSPPSPPPPPPPPLPPPLPPFSPGTVLSWIALQSAVQNANPGEQVILYLPEGVTYALDGQELSVTNGKNVTLSSVGEGAVLDANGTSRHFDVNGASVQVNSIQLVGGSATVRPRPVHPLVVAGCGGSLRARQPRARSAHDGQRHAARTCGPTRAP